MRTLLSVLCWLACAAQALAANPPATGNKVDAKIDPKLGVKLEAKPDAKLGDKVQVRWQGKTVASDALPANFPVAAREAVTLWQPFCKRASYRLEVDATGRVVLVIDEKSSRGEDQARVAAKTTAWFDAHFPVPTRIALKPSAPVAQPEPPSGGDSGEIPEDPESPPVGVPSKPGDSGKTTHTETPAWGTGSIEPDTKSAVLFVLRTEDDYKALLEEMSKANAFLRGWAETARKETGFVTEGPLCAAYIENASGMEEWSPEHEIVNRMAQLLLLRRFGQQSYWLQLGVAWAAEWAYDGALYCFPYRTEFIGVGEHGAWPVELKNEFGDRPGKPLALPEFCGMERGHWDGPRAKLAFGFTSFLATQPPAKLSAALEELRVFRDADNRKSTSEATWGRDPRYEVPAEKQLALLEKCLGPDLLKKATVFLSKGADSFKALEKSGPEKSGPEKSGPAKPQ